jgi:hypothetical protein
MLRGGRHRCIAGVEVHLVRVGDVARHDGARSTPRGEDEDDPLPGDYDDADAAQAALVQTLADALGVVADAVSVTGVAANGSAASVGVVLNADSGAAAAVLAAALDALAPVSAPAGLAGALAAALPLRRGSLSESGRRGTARERGSRGRAGGRRGGWREGMGERMEWRGREGGEGGPGRRSRAAAPTGHVAPRDPPLLAACAEQILPSNAALKLR